MLRQLDQYLKCTTTTNSTVLLGKRIQPLPETKHSVRKNEVPVKKNVRLQAAPLSAAHPFTFYSIRFF